MAIEQSIAEECVDFALFFGINPHYMLGVSKMRSGLTDTNQNGLFGPFRLSIAEWEANRADTEFEFNFAAPQITSWRRTCDVFALMTYRTQNKLLARLQRYPSALELYQEQWPTNLPATLAADFKTALDTTAALIAPAVATLDNPAESGGTLAQPIDAILPAPAQNIQVASSFGTGPFNVKAPRVMRALIDDFRLTSIQAAGILGNFGQESGGFRFYHEIGQPLDQGGVGWAQWTGVRRRSFEIFCSIHGIDPMSDEGSYDYLKFELTSTAERAVLAQLRQTTTLDDAVAIFERIYERAGVTALNTRVQYAKIALSSFDSQSRSA